VTADHRDEDARSPDGGSDSLPNETGRDAGGHFSSGNMIGERTRFREHNEASLKHGLRRFEARGAIPSDLKVSLEEFRAEVICDLGGADELTGITKGYVRGLVDLDACRRLLQADIMKNGLITPKGRVRGIYTKLLETMDRWDRYAQRLGVERKAKPITFAESIRARGIHDE
jgi:hypothetical protein